MLVVVARIAATDNRLIVCGAQNFLVSLGKLKIYHRVFLVVLLED
jgi:hypothetical protein